MQGVILAAGLGTRLYPLTLQCPKALVQVKGKPMLEWTLEAMIRAGVDDVIVNVHAFADQVEQWLNQYAENHPALKIRCSDERECLLETGGGLKQMAPMLGNDAFLVHNVDVLSTVDLAALWAADVLNRQRYDGLLATLAVRSYYTDRCFLVNKKGLLCGWENVRTHERIISRPDETDYRRVGFMGIQVMHPSLVKLMEETGVFSLTPVLLRLAARYTICVHEVSDALWFDVGSPEAWREAAEQWPFSVD
jgi:NDP-sugar pyrophosphorylase family protein